MKIAIDIRTVFGHRLGKGNYTYHLVKNLLSLDRENEYLLLMEGDGEPPFEEHSYMNVSRSAVRLWKDSGMFWHLQAKRKMLAEKIDVFFSPTSFITPALLPSSIRSVVVVHDLVAFLFPKTHQTKATWLEKLFLKKALRKAAHIITVSENTAQDLSKFFPFAETKPCSVIYPAASEVFFQDIPAEDLLAFRKTKNLPEKFFLAVGTLEPRKNLETLFDAYEKFMNGSLAASSLVMVGSHGWKNEKLMNRLRALEKAGKLHLLPYLPENDLAKLYRLATAFVFPSLYEGFGMPPLEAMASGCPVIASNTSSLPEACGDAALFFQPRDAEKLSHHLKTILTDEKLRTMLIERGKQQAQKFSWKKSAEKLLNIFEHL